MRRLFINVIVNSVSKGKAKPKLKLYNKCDEEGNKHENCDDRFVDPKDDDDNKTLSKVGLSLTKLAPRVYHTATVGSSRSSANICACVKEFLLNVIHRLV